MFEYRYHPTELAYRKLFYVVAYWGGVIVLSTILSIIEKIYLWFRGYEIFPWKLFVLLIYSIDTNGLFSNHSWTRDR